MAVPAPGPGDGRWVGAPSAAVDPDGGFVVAYRVRVVDRRGAATVVAGSADGEALTTVASVGKERFGAVSMERPAVVRTPEGRWRLYVCCATPASKHWWIDVLEAADPEGWPTPRPPRCSPATCGSGSRTRSSGSPTAAGTPGSAATRWTSRARRTA